MFAHHCTSVSSNYSADIHDQTKALVASLQSGLTPFLRHPEIEVQERAIEFAQLCAFIAADLAGFQPRQSNGGADPEVLGGFEADTEAEKDGPDVGYPKSLFLFPPLFGGYELNAVAYKAQEAVRVPDGLDLEREIVPRCGFGGEAADEGESEEEKDEVDLGEGGGEGMEELRRVLREQEEGRRRKGMGKGKGKKKEEMTAEEVAERAKVSSDEICTGEAPRIGLMPIAESGKESEDEGQPVLPRGEGRRPGCRRHPHREAGPRA